MKALIAAYARTPFHFAKKGALASTRPESLAAQAMVGVLKARKATTSPASPAFSPGSHKRWVA